MPACDDFAHELRMLGGTFTDEKEQRFDVMPVQNVENRRGVLRVRTVINREQRLVVSRWQAFDHRTKQRTARHQRADHHGGQDRAKQQHGLQSLSAPQQPKHHQCR